MVGRGIGNCEPFHLESSMKPDTKHAQRNKIVYLNILGMEVQEISEKNKIKIKLGNKKLNNYNLYLPSLQKD